MSATALAAPANAPQLLSKEQRETFTVESLAAKSQADLNDIYSSLTSGQIPDGESKGTVVFDDSGDNAVEKLLSALEPSGQLEDFIKGLGTQLWQGKVFFKQENMLLNRIGPVLKFPAKVGCGKSLLDASKESIVLDYSVGESLPGYDPLLDWTMSKNGLNIRDEIRMVKPGLYLGRAYAGNGVYVLNFIIEFPNAYTGPSAWRDACKKA